MPAATIRPYLAGLALALLLAAASRAAGGDEPLRAIEAAIGKQDHARAIALADQYIQAHPGEARPFMLRGFARLNQGDFDRGIADLTEAIRLDPALYQAHVLRGRARMVKGQFTDALADLDEAVKTAPADPFCVLARGQLHYFQKDYAKALADFDRTIELNPTSPDGYRWRGDVHAIQKRYAEALTEYGRALEQDAGSAETYLRRGSVYTKTKEYAKAADDYQQAIKLAPSYTVGYNNLAWLLATCPDDALRNGKKALALAEKACILGKYHSANDVDTLAAAYAELGRFADAVRWQERALRLLPATPPERRADYENRLALYKQGKPYRGE